MTHDLNPDAKTRKAVFRNLNSLVEVPTDALPGRLSAVSSTETQWRVAHPINEMTGPEAASERIFLPLREAMPDAERRDWIFVGGAYQDRRYIAAIGAHCGTFVNPWLGIPATGGAVTLRYGEVYEIDEAGRIMQANLLWDVLDLIRQSGHWPLAPSLGAEGAWLPPLTGDGLRLAGSDPETGAASIAQTLAMHATLAEHDDEKGRSREALLNMPQREHWHPKMMWYGPAGIGTTRGLAGFVDYHQLPFRIAFQRPQGTFEEVNAARARHGAGHFIRIGDGPYSVTGGWPSVYGVHGGGGFCGLAPTGKPVTMRVMDFYLHHEGLIRENWVPLDMLDLLNQMGIDVMARMAETLPPGLKG